MASGSKVAIANTSTYVQGCLSWDANVSGSSIVVNVRFYMRRTNNYSGSTGTSSCNQRICISGDPNNYGYSQTDAVWVEGNKQNQWQGPYFSASRTFDASRGGETIYVGWKVDGDSTGHLNGSGNVQITLPTAYQAPATPTVSASNASGSSNSVTYGTTSFGVPSSGTVYLYGGTSASPTAQIATKTTTGNSTYTHSGLSGNTRYYYRSKASNSQLSSAYSSDSSVVTKAPLPTYVEDSLAIGVDSVSFQVSYPADGGYYPKTVRYSLDGSTYTNTSVTISGSSAQTATVTITGLSPRTTYNIRLDTQTTAGNTQGYNTVPEFTTKGNCYGSVSGQTKQIVKGYCSIGGETTKILKIYGSEDGLTKRVF